MIGWKHRSGWMKSPGWREEVLPDFGVARYKLRCAWQKDFASSFSNIVWKANVGVSYKICQYAQYLNSNSYYRIILLHRHQMQLISIGVQTAGVCVCRTSVGMSLIQIGLPAPCTLFSFASLWDMDGRILLRSTIVCRIHRLLRTSVELRYFASNQHIVVVEWY